MKRSLALWAAPVAWMIVIHWLSSGRWGADETRSILTPLLETILPRATPSEIDLVHGLVRKCAHVGEYAVLAALWFRALVRGAALGPATAARVALAISVGWAILDEAYQLSVPNRGASLVDVGIDAAGALGSLAIARSSWSWVDRATGVALWVGAVGGGAAIVVNRWSDVDSGPLWFAVPVAAVALVLRRLTRRWSWPPG